MEDLGANLCDLFEMPDTANEQIFRIYMRMKIPNYKWPPGDRYMLWDLQLSSRCNVFVESLAVADNKTLMNSKSETEAIATRCLNFKRLNSGATSSDYECTSDDSIDDIVTFITARGLVWNAKCEEKAESADDAYDKTPIVEIMVTTLPKSKHIGF